jgi:serine O-acetyltransferase
MAVFHLLLADGDRFAAVSHPNTGRAIGRLRFLVHPSAPVILLVRLITDGPRLSRRLARWLLVWRSCDVQPGARIGPGLVLPHPFGIVVGSHVVVGANCTLYQHVTLGAGHGGMPVLGDAVTIYSAAVVAGAVTIGSGVRIRALSLVTSDVPANGGD